MKKYKKQFDKKIKEFEKRIEKMEKDWNNAVDNFHVENTTEIPVHDCNRR